MGHETLEPHELMEREDFESERARLQTQGFALRTGQHPFMPVDAFYLDDPDGNEIEIATWRGQ